MIAARGGADGEELESVVAPNAFLVHGRFEARRTDDAVSLLLRNDLPADVIGDAEPDRVDVAAERAKLARGSTTNEAILAYRRRPRDDTGHECRNCSSYPTTDCGEKPSGPTTGERRDKETAGNRRKKSSDPRAPSRGSATRKGVSLSGSPREARCSHARRKRPARRRGDCLATASPRRRATAQPGDGGRIPTDRRSDSPHEGSSQATPRVRGGTAKTLVGRMVGAPTLPLPRHATLRQPSGGSWRRHAIARPTSRLGCRVACGRLQEPTDGARSGSPEASRPTAGRGSAAAATPAAADRARRVRTAPPAAGRPPRGVLLRASADRLPKPRPAPRSALGCGHPEPGGCGRDRATARVNRIEAGPHRRPSRPPAGTRGGLWVVDAPPHSCGVSGRA